ncbi:MAG: hydroxysqualene dehydroxylase HpnE [Luteimonas sp.]
MADADAIVVGGGLAGLACAMALGDHGLRVRVLEAGDNAGGRARSVSDQATGDRVDIGPHIVLSEYRNMLRLLEQLGTQHHMAWQGSRFITFVDKPRPVTFYVRPLPAPLHFMPSLLRIPQVSLADIASNARLFWRVMRLRAHDVQRLDGDSAEAVLRRWGVRSRFIDWYWRTVSMAIMNVPLERCSAGALFGFFRYMIGVGGYQIGFAARGLGDLFVPQAMRRIAAQGGDVLLRTRVAQLEPGREGDVAGVRLADGSVLHAPRVVSALPPQDLLPLLPQAWSSAHATFRNVGRFAPSPYISTYLWFDRKLTHERFWAKVWSPETLNYDFYDLSNIRDGWQRRNSLVASNLIYSERAHAMSDEDIVAATVRELSEYVPEAAKAQVVHARVHRIPMAIPAPYPGSERMRPGNTTPIDGLFFAGDWTHTGLPASMESAVRSGWLAAEQVLSAAGRPQSIVSPLPRMEGLVRLIAGAAPAA